MPSDELVEAMARAAADDPDARLIARKGDTVCFDDMDPETPEFWCCIARATLAVAEPAIRADERERAAKVLDERAAMYRKKAARHSALADDTLTEHERLTSNAEATEWGATAIRAGQGERG